jgi:hypothetical protein
MITNDNFLSGAIAVIVTKIAPRNELKLAKQGVELLK